jgi:hypothetical protein
LVLQVLPAGYQLQIPLMVWQGISLICGVVSASQNTNLDLGNLSYNLNYIRVELGLKTKLVNNRITLDFHTLKKN